MILQPLVPADGALPGPVLDATAHRQGHGAAVAALVEERFREDRRPAGRLRRR
ncbi:hypothetical protein [Streptomyces goshikiensis]|uniref:hypothetical protein n=1 Tax=Streptomyces goshikiensis TaxID=1942 RepID=UPI00340BCEA5